MQSTPTTQRNKEAGVSSLIANPGVGWGWVADEIFQKIRPHAMDTVTTKLNITAPDGSPDILGNALAAALLTAPVTGALLYNNAAKRVDKEKSAAIPALLAYPALAGLAWYGAREGYDLINKPIQADQTIDIDLTNGNFINPNTGNGYLSPTQIAAGLGILSAPIAGAYAADKYLTNKSEEEDMGNLTDNLVKKAGITDAIIRNLNKLPFMERAAKWLAGPLGVASHGAPIQEAALRSLMEEGIAANAARYTNPSLMASYSAKLSALPVETQALISQAGTNSVNSSSSWLRSGGNSNPINWLWKNEGGLTTGAKAVGVAGEGGAIGDYVTSTTGIDPTMINGDRPHMKIEGDGPGIGTLALLAGVPAAAYWAYNNLSDPVGSKMEPSKKEEPKEVTASVRLGVSLIRNMAGVN